MSGPRYHTSVFLNCPFDSQYKPIFDAVVFTVYYAEMFPRCALEIDDAAETRLDKIFRIIGECKYGIHDISRTEPDPVHQLPRFNMPMELGIYLGCKRYGGSDQSKKACLVLDREPYRYQKYLSDIAGQDIHPHRDDPRTAVAEVRSWLRTASGRTRIAGGEQIWSRYTLFRQALPEICRSIKIRPEELTFVDFGTAVVTWLKQNP